ncbi:MAG: FtsX-like permease family protein [Bacteroidales bacterium]
MIWNYIKMSFRHILRHKSYVIINIAGLSIGLVCSIIIGLFVIHELSYDKFNVNKDRIYRVYLKGKMGESQLRGAWTCSSLGPAFRQEFPEVQEFVRVNRWGETVLKYNHQGYIENDFGEADSSFFRIFSIPLLKGDPDKVLASKYTLVLTEATAKKIFGDEEPVGKMLQVGNDTTYYTVTGIMADFPKNAHFYFTALSSFMTNPRAEDPTWLSNSFSTYLLLQDENMEPALSKKIPDFVNSKVGPEVEKFMGIDLDQFVKSGNEYGYFLQRLTDIHLDPSISHDQKPTNDKKYVYIFTLVAILILLMASINYTNLATARSAGRALEIGIRKISGSGKASLIGQFLVESFLLTCLSLVMALVLVELLLGPVNSILGMQLSLNLFSSWYMLPALLLLAIILGLMAGLYPSLYLAAFQPLIILTQSKKSASGGKLLRNVLVVLQLLGSVFLIFMSTVIYRQVNFMLNTNLGYDKENLLVIRRADALNKNLGVFLEEVSKLPGVLKASHSTAIPNYPNNHNGYLVEGMPIDKSYLMQTFWVDMEFLETYKLQMAQGRFFSKDFPGDSTACIINESAVKQFGFSDPMSVRVMRPLGGEEKFSYHQVVGVVKDFHYQSLHERIYPCVFFLDNRYSGWGYITVRIDPQYMKKTVAEVEKLWTRHTVNDPMVYFYFSDDYRTIYKEDRRTGTIALSFAILAIIIASLGLFGLTSFTTEQRTKEIGIRKSLGASTWKVMMLLFRNVVILLLIATVIAWGLGTWFANLWLENFVFKTSLTAWEYLLSLLIVSLISFITIAYQSYKAASTNPANALKYE